MNNLNVISQLNEYKNHTMKKYNINGVDYVGVYGNERFAIDYYNPTANKVQVKVALDGTDILTGLEANLDINDKMWVVNPYSHLQLKAWVQSNKGGAEFVFTDASNSVASHTHGNTSNKGIISVAVYKDFNPPNQSGYYASKTLQSFSYKSPLRSSLGGLESMGLQNMAEIGELKSSASVGAGHYVEQNITNVQGLREPRFSHIEVVRYVWWSELVAMLEQEEMRMKNQPTGFLPGVTQHQFMSLGTTPVVGEPVRPEDKYNRF